MLIITALGPKADDNQMYPLLTAKGDANECSDCEDDMYLSDLFPDPADNKEDEDNV